MKRTITLMTLAAAFLFITEAAAQTPVESLIDRYSEVKGARDFIASGGKMNVARSLIRNTQLASIAPDVDVLEVLRMQNASPADIKRFETDLKSALKGYEFYGKDDSPNGTVEIYLMNGSNGTIEELVIYNPEKQALNSLKGRFTKQELMSIKE